MQFDKNTLVACAATAAVASAVTCIACKRCCKQGGASAATEEDPSISRVRYETEALTNQYLEFHFTPSSTTFTHPLNSIEQAFDFPTRLAKKFVDFKPAKSDRILDLGCAVGVTAIEMARDFKEVVGIDLSSAFINKANQVLKDGKISFEAPDQGHLTIPRSYTVPSEIDRSRVKFVVGDALNIDPALGNFDGLLAANLLCRVPDGEILFKQFEARINKGGLLVIVSPYSWSEEATNVKKWFGGHSGVRSEGAVKKRLSESFELLDERNEPFLIRDHSRRFQLGFSHCTVWRRK